MPGKTFKLEFKGYWREPNITGIPAQSGVFCAYTCTFFEAEKTVTIHKLLYIGSSDDVRATVAANALLQSLQEYKDGTQQLCFSFAPVGPEGRERVEAALIHHHKPPGNTSDAEEFPFPKTTLELSGAIALLAPNFTVNRDGG
jgi:hypothetical protein